MEVDKTTVSEDEWYGDWYRCPNPNCKGTKSGETTHYLWNDFKFCPYCGIKLEWKNDTK